MKYLLILASLIISTLVIAQPGPRHGGPVGPGGRERMVEGLKLSAEQEQQFETLSSALEKKQIAIRSKIMSLRVDLRGLMRAEAPSKTDIQALQAQIHALRGEMQTNHTDYWFDVNKILTPEQRKDWKHALGSLPHRAEGGRKPMGHGPWNRHLGM